MKIRTLLSILLSFTTISALFAQTGTVRGNVYDRATGEPVAFATVLIEGTTLGTNTDDLGFYSLSNIAAGDYRLVVTYLGYDSSAIDLKLVPGAIVFHSFYMDESSVQLDVVNISARKERSRSDVQVSKVLVTPRQIRSLPSTGGDSDIAQYLPVLPGIISSGDQGGQLFIRGGAPIQNLILLDGMTLFNPFHSIGFFSVFETETIRSVDVYTGGFGAEYGGRASAVLDIKTREGNKKRLAGMTSVSPFMAKVLLEGPIKKLTEEGGGSTSFMLTGKHSYIDQTSRALYSYAESAIDPTINGLPFNFTDMYGKVSMLSGNGSRLDLFGFNFLDRVNYDVASLGWNSFGAGANFYVVPPNSNVVFGGNIAYSDYNIQLLEADGNPRDSRINSYSVQLDFTYYGYRNEFRYGFNFTSLNTDFNFRNFLGNTIEQRSFTSEAAAYFKYKQRFGDKFIFEPGFRFQYYATQGTLSPEPRIAAKYLITDGLRIKFSGGLFSQNLMSSVNELDVVNLFVGFLTGPQQTIFEPGTNNPASDRLQKAYHAIGGVEVDLGRHFELNVEPYYKGFTQLIQLNRNKQAPTDPNFVIETGEAYGIDFSLRYENRDLYLWGTYSYGFVNRDDGDQIYPTVFDRRHNINLLGSYTFGENKNWELGVRWNFGSAFPFTQTQGFFGAIDFVQDGQGTDPLTANPDLGILYSDIRNGGRLLAIHRLDASIKRNIDINPTNKLVATLSITNLYNRENIFYIDRRTAQRVDQLPILPSLALSWNF